MNRLLKPLKNNRGEGYIDVVVLVLCAMLVVALAVKVFPAYIAKQKVDTFATELIFGRYSHKDGKNRKRATKPIMARLPLFP